MSVENAHAFIDEMKRNGPSAKLFAQIGTKFDKSHMQEALKSRGIDLKQASGGSTVNWIVPCSSAAAAN